MLIYLCQLIGFVYIFLLFLAASGGPGLIRPNGYSPRGGWGPRPRHVYVGDAKPPKHGSAHMIMSFEDFIDSKPGKLQYFNAETDEFQDEKP